MSLANWYLNLTDALTYNSTYAPDYPDEDRTSLEKEYDKIIQYFTYIRIRVRSAYKIKQLDFAKTKIEEGFQKYKSGKDGYKQLDEAIEFIKRSKKKEDDPINFIATADGKITFYTEQK